MILSSIVKLIFFKVSLIKKRKNTLQLRSGGGWNHLMTELIPNQIKLMMKAKKNK
jgi:hypothetical protein